MVDEGVFDVYVIEKHHGLKLIHDMVLCLMLQLRIYLRFFFATPELTTIVPPTPIIEAATAAAV